jgi:hypothetical protein
VKHRVLAPEVANYVVKAPNLTRAQKVAAEHGLAADWSGWVSTPRIDLQKDRESVATCGTPPKAERLTQPEGRCSQGETPRGRPTARVYPLAALNPIVLTQRVSIFSESFNITAKVFDLVRSTI